MYGNQCRCFFRSRRYLILSGIVILIFLMHQLMSVKQLGKELSRRRSPRNYQKADGPIHVERPETAVPGVHPSNWKFYTPSNKNTFMCLNSGEEISFSLVNDDFCDCTDFSDEPSTSACNIGQFYCSSQSIHSPKFIVSYKVNDGVCDCCDGSDEWKHTPLPQHVIVPAGNQKGVYQSPCPNTCTS